MNVPWLIEGAAEDFLVVKASDEWRQMPVQVSGVFISFNHSNYIERALQSVLLQDYPIQLVISDDFSEDDTAKRIQKLLHDYSGHHHVSFRRATRNLGVCRNQNLAISHASAELIVLFEGDDISVRTRVSDLVTAYLASGRSVAALGSGVHKIDEAGVAKQLVVWPANRCDARTFVEKGWDPTGCTLAFRRDCFVDIGPISKHLLSGDIAVVMRAAFMNNGGLWSVPKALVFYRIHARNVSGSRPISYDSLDSLMRFALAWLPNEIAKIREWRKISRYRDRLKSKGDGYQFRRLGRILRLRARLIYVVAKRPRRYWIWPALRSLPAKPLRSLSVNVMAAAISPRIYQFIKLCRVFLLSKLAMGPAASERGDFRPQ